MKIACHLSPSNDLWIPVSWRIAPPIATFDSTRTSQSISSFLPSNDLSSQLPDQTNYSHEPYSYCQQFRSFSTEYLTLIWVHFISMFDWPLFLHSLCVSQYFILCSDSISLHSISISPQVHFFPLLSFENSSQFNFF